MSSVVNNSFSSTNVFMTFVGVLAVAAIVTGILANYDIWNVVGTSDAHLMICLGGVTLIVEMIIALVTSCRSSKECIVEENGQQYSVAESWLRSKFPDKKSYCEVLIEGQRYYLIKEPGEEPKLFDASKVTYRILISTGEYQKVKVSA